MTGPATVYEHGKTHFADWGYPEQTLSLDSFTASTGGTYYIQIDFGNGRPVDTGIACGAKRVEVFDNSDDSLAGSGDSGDAAPGGRRLGSLGLLLLRARGAGGGDRTIE